MEAGGEQITTSVKGYIHKYYHAYLVYDVCIGVYPFVYWWVLVRICAYLFAYWCVLGAYWCVLCVLWVRMLCVFVRIFLVMH